MLQAKFSLDESHIDFLAQYRRYGFKDKSAVVRNALDRSRKELAQRTPVEHGARLVRLRGELEDEEMGKIDDALRIVFDIVPG